jgi:superfamily II DNA or RNA helicase
MDAPSVKTAYFLASSSNPIQFVQRRGRILRKFKGKKKAVIHDFIVVPHLKNPRKYLSDEEFETERKILKRELSRFKEFSDAAQNSFRAIESILNVAKMYNILDY